MVPPPPLPLQPVPAEVAAADGSSVETADEPEDRPVSSKRAALDPERPAPEPSGGRYERLKKRVENIERSLDERFARQTEQINEMFNVVNNSVAQLAEQLTQALATLTARMDDVEARLPPVTGRPIRATGKPYARPQQQQQQSPLMEAETQQQQPSRRILESLGITYTTQCGEKTAVPTSVRDRLIVPPLPKNMHPTHHVGRRNRRASDLQRRFGNSDEAVYVDAARYGERRRAHAIAVVNRTGNCIASATVRTGHTEAAEEAAIALALVAAPDATVVISDFAGGPAADLVAASAPESGTVATAGEDVTTDEQQQQPEWSWGDRLTTFRDITQHYRLNRRKYPPPHDKLNKTEAVTWRLLQTHTYPSPATLRRCYPSLYPTDACKTCGNRATLRHMLWECAGKQTITATAHVAEDVSQGENSSSTAAAAAAVAAADRLRRRRRRWEGALTSDDLADQLWAVQQAEAAARVQGLRAVT
ncbi:hypothetical protein HPB47_019278 [Ixodes persulcatus]|uniref:Uncharacterized protein n=1 Tax=Ixodes persulcatus TaxID=34615 RepID=A0AC60QM72_IXOPE|nr:hypothetical protein HPB47_019278 [Ixodes persulcatus]